MQRSLCFGQGGIGETGGGEHSENVCAHGGSWPGVRHEVGEVEGFAEILGVTAKIGVGQFSRGDGADNRITDLPRDAEGLVLAALAHLTEGDLHEVEVEDLLLHAAGGVRLLPGAGDKLGGGFLLPRLRHGTKPPPQKAEAEHGGDDEAEEALFLFPQSHG